MITPMTLYRDCLNAGIPTDHHESDLYILDCPEAQTLLIRHNAKASTFISEIDGKRWIEVPFAYDPHWTT